jgi:hypothetical protein
VTEGAFHQRRRPWRVTRRDMLRVGSLGIAGLSLPGLLAAESKTAESRDGGSPRRGKARSCILFFLEGGPAHQDTFDMKPDAPEEYRGEFQPIATSEPGVWVCEHLPRLARQMHHVAQVRSVHHRVVDHNAGAYYALTGRAPFEQGRLIISESPSDFPPFGSVMARLRPPGSALPAFVHLPDLMFNNNFDLPGQKAGFLGPAFDPFVVGDPSAPNYEVPGLKRVKDVSAERFQDRKGLLAQLDQARGLSPADPEVARLSIHLERAFELLSSSASRKAFDLSQEPAALRERYGLPDRVDRSVEARKFGGLPHLGQCMLMARRLVESGVRLVTVCTGRRIDQSWDTHRDHFPLLKKSLLPYTDVAFSALLEDLDQRGLLDETLVVAMGEFGRTPKLGQTTSSAGADKAGRDHWPNCYSVLLAGGGVRGGAVYGASDRHAAYPAERPVTPEDIAATIYHALGIDPETRVYDQLDRPHSVALGKPILDLFG